MKLVIDSNQLQTDQLRNFLAKSRENFAVLPDFVAMEAYKGEPLKTIFKSMAVLSDFPQQVIVLKGSAKVCGLSGRRKGLRRRLVDDHQTRAFPEYIRALRIAETGDSRLQTQILNFGQFANDHLDKMQFEARNIRGAIEILGNRFAKDERAILRSRDACTPEVIDKVVRTVVEMTAAIFQGSPHVRRRPSYKELPNTFVFRVTFGCYLLGLRRFALGGFGELSPEKLGGLKSEVQHPPA